MAAFCIDIIVHHADQMEARERIKFERETGKIIKQKIGEQKGAVSAGKAFGAGTVRLGKMIFDLVSAGKTENRRIMNEKVAKARQDHKKKQAAASVILALGKHPRELTVAQLKVLLGALKRPDDGAVPIQKRVMLEKLEEWGRRGSLTEEEEVAMVETVFATETRTDAAGMDDNEGGEIEEGEYVGV